MISLGGEKSIWQGWISIFYETLFILLLCSANWISRLQLCITSCLVTTTANSWKCQNGQFGSNPVWFVNRSIQNYLLEFIITIAITRRFDSLPWLWVHSPDPFLSIPRLYSNLWLTATVQQTKSSAAIHLLVHYSASWEPKVQWLPTFTRGAYIK